MTTPSPTPTRAPDLPPVFAPPVVTWLERRGCRHGRWVDRRQAPLPDARQLDFFLDMEAVSDDAVALRLAFDEAAALTEADKAAVSAYLAALGPFLREVASSDADRMVTLSRAMLLALEHQLRNHLNSLLMNAAALGLLCQAQDGLDTYLDQMECDGQNCLEVLRWLVDAAA